MLINLIFSELVISLFGIPLDFIGSVTRGAAINHFLCSIQGSIHTFFGNNIYIF